MGDHRTILTLIMHGEFGGGLAPGWRGELGAIGVWSLGGKGSEHVPRKPGHADGCSHEPAVILRIAGGRKRVGAEKSIKMQKSA